jgi:hypothetical protein
LPDETRLGDAAAGTSGSSWRLKGGSKVAIGGLNAVAALLVAKEAV